MVNIEIPDRKLLTAYRELRLKNFKINLPFLILSEKLPKGQAYREFRDGHIEIHKVYSVGPDLKSKHIRTLTLAEAEKVRIEHGLH
jgi:hypothetical protein